MRNRRLLVLLSACAVSLACGGSSASSGPSAPGPGTTTPASYATLSDACTGYCARFGPPCTDPTYSDSYYRNCLSSCRGLSGCCTGTGCICESACR